MAMASPSEPRRKGGRLETPTVGRIRELLRAGRSVTAIAIEVDVAPKTVYRYASELGITFDPTAPRPSRRRAAVLDATWSPDCMTGDEWATWQAMKPAGNLTDRERNARPCDDCPLGYAADMRAQGRCNGTPGGIQDDEEEPMAIADSMTADGRVAARLLAPPEQKRVERSVALSLPCHACIHREVCRIRETLTSLERLPVLLPQLDPALSVDVGATVDCSLFKAERGLKSRNVSPEALEAMRKNAAIMRERKAAKRAGGVTE